MVAELRDTTFAFAFAFSLCFLCVFLVLKLMGDDGDDAMGFVMVVLSWAHRKRK